MKSIRYVGVYLSLEEVLTRMMGGGEELVRMLGGVGGAAIVDEEMLRGSSTIDG